MLGVKQVIYKTHKIKSQYCTICETFLSGDGSIGSSWECDCGVYKLEWISGWKHPNEPDNLPKKSNPKTTKEGNYKNE